MIKIVFVLFTWIVFQPMYIYSNSSTIYKSDILNIQQLGAIGDGITDNTHVFELAFSKSTPKTIIIPKGTYIVSRTLKPVNGKRIKFENAILKVSNKFVKGKGQEYAVILVNEKDVVIDGVIIDANDKSLKLSGITASNNSNNLLVKNSKIINCGGTGFIVHANSTENVQFVNCLAINNTIGFGQEKWQYRNGYPKNIKYVNCSARNCNYGLYIAGGTALIDHCYFQGAGRFAAFFYIGDTTAELTNIITHNTTFEQTVNYVNISIVATQKLRLGKEVYSNLNVSFDNCIFKNPVNVNRIIEVESPANVTLNNCSFQGGVGQMLIKNNPVKKYKTIFGNIIINECKFLNSSSFGISTSLPIKLTNSLFQSSVGNNYAFALNLQDYAHGSFVDNVTFGNDYNNAIKVGVKKQKQILDVKLKGLKVKGNTQIIQTY